MFRYKISSLVAGKQGVVRTASRTISSTSWKDPTVASVSTHTMGNSLSRYLKMKVHPDIQERSWPEILIRGGHVRDFPGRISSVEKADKPFNWQRPTTILSHDGGLELCCFPGKDYVRHYAAIVATYLSLQGRDPSIVRYIEPSFKDCMAPLLCSNLLQLGQVDIAVLGYVHGLKDLVGPGEWVGGRSDELFAWKARILPNGLKVAFIGCRVSFWGDIAGNLVRALQDVNGVKAVLYIGKLGTLRPQHTPNYILATGDTSIVHGAVLKWQNPLALIDTTDPTIVHGRHCTLSSVLDETRSWLDEHKHICDWVDPEIGHMALASVAGSTQFGYLHIVSDNLAKKYVHDLSNERQVQVLKDRKTMVAKIEAVVEKFFESYNG